MKVGDKVILRECDNRGVRYSWRVVTKVGRKYFGIEPGYRDTRYHIGNGYIASEYSSGQRVFSTLSELYDDLYRSVGGRLILSKLHGQQTYHSVSNVITIPQLREIALMLGLAEEIDNQVKERIGHLETHTEDSQ